ncbi:MAG: TIGR04053 family radical SAM/SPASM domain-containing protein [Thaumarchaeota archaeon]|nr:TIGR04053 family radical SAM/SPASM domain-containing protein [Nitrososphaerota archaeon]
MSHKTSDGRFDAAEAGSRSFANRPVLVFWETTRACPLYCIHCRASAVSQPLLGELTTEEGFRLIDDVTSFGRPYPTIIFTGGDPLKRDDLFELMLYASRLGVGFAVSPAVSELLTKDALKRMRNFGASSVSISLDGATAESHDAIRRKDGTYDRTIDAVKEAVELGLNVQVNTVIMRKNFFDLPRIFHLIKSLGVKTWELFFLVKVGRGTEVEELVPEEYESACNLLYDASCYGLTVRCVEAPFIRRVAGQRLQSDTYWNDDAYLELKSELLRLEGGPTTPSTLRPRGTLDGDGVIFVAYDGTIYPGGLLPVGMGNVRSDSLVRIYGDDNLLRRIRAREIDGPCGVCEFKDICGGSRARAYSYSGDPLSSDPACIYVTART